MKQDCPPLNDNITKSMKSNKRKDTKPELLLRKELREAGFPGYRLQWDVPGRPDICYPGRRIAIFVNGCFWHRCPFCNLSAPKHNHDFWVDKFDNNVKRDERNYETLKQLGWTVIVVWECELKKQSISNTIQRIISIIGKSNQRTLRF